MAKPKKMLTTKDFSQKAGVSTTTVSGWLKKGKITGKKEGNKWLIPESELKKTGGAKSAPSSSRKTGSSKTKAKATPTKKKGTAKKTKPAKMAPKKKKSAGGKSLSVSEFSAMTYLTESGVEKWLKEGRLTGSIDASGKITIDASNLEDTMVNRLLR